MLAKTLHQNLSIDLDPHEPLSITAGEFASTQTNKLLKEFLPDAYQNLPETEKFVGMNNLDLQKNGSVKDYELGIWTFRKSIELIESLNNKGGRQDIILDIVVNDLVLNVEQRSLIKDKFIEYFPEPYQEILSNNGMWLTSEGQIITSNGKSITLNFVFESTLRNRAFREKKRLKNKGILLDDHRGLCIVLDADRIELESNTPFTITSGKALYLYNDKEVAVCNSIMLMHYLQRKDRTIVNIANYDWKCGYRGGAIALYSVLNHNKPIYNLFYVIPKDEGLCGDVFIPGTK